MARKNILILSLACLALTSLSAEPLKIPLQINSKNSFMLSPKSGGKKVGILSVTPIGDFPAYDLAKDPFGTHPNGPIALAANSMIVVPAGNCTFDISADANGSPFDMDLIIFWKGGTSSNPKGPYELSFNLKNTPPNSPAFNLDTAVLCDTSAYKIDNWKGHW